jgi:ectoine hydroxylase-related dioxygenase (phytanoyl-CoA dioxygenase family)
VTALDFRRHGVELRKGLVAESELRAILAEMAAKDAVLDNAGIRNLEKKYDSVARLAADPVLLGLAAELLGGPVRLVRALFFDKTLGRNWALPWHQDKTVTLNRRVEMEGWGPWSEKDGVCHVQPPCSVLDRMLTIRLHIDPCDEESGCLRVIPGSHLSGILKPGEVSRRVAAGGAVPCIASAGDAVVMRPHILHSSRRSVRLSHRRVVHLEFSDYELPAGVHWA